MSASIIASSVLAFTLGADAQSSSDGSLSVGPHDFDLMIGRWTTQVTRLLHPLSGATAVAHYEGTSVVSPVWNGRANVLELEVDGPAGHLDGLGLRLYNPESHQWSLNWASSADGEFQPPMIGQFIAGRGEFYDQEIFAGKSILSKNAFSDVSAKSARFEQSFSADGGRSWETNWTMTFTSVSAQAPTKLPSVIGRPAAGGHDGWHDFDFAIGTWHTHILRLKHPLSGSNEWLTYEGTHTIRKLWDGRANLGELMVDGAAGHIEALSPRLYNPRTGLWSVSYANPREGTLSRPVVGQFKQGRGEFFGQDSFNGRAVLVREIYTPIDASTRQLEIAYSQDGGQTWETNWKMTDSRVGPPP
jgi:hypothetical protein